MKRLVAASLLLSLSGCAGGSGAAVSSVGFASAFRSVVASIASACALRNADELRPYSNASAPRLEALGGQPVGLDAQGDASAWDVTYELVAGTRLEVSDTVLGAGNAVRDVGPGSITLRFLSERCGSKGCQPAEGQVQLVALKLTTNFTITVGILGLEARLATTAASRHVGVVPFGRGTMRGGELSWQGPVAGYEAAGTVHCEGALCGTMGAPPAGKSKVGTARRDVEYPAFRFHDGLRAFVMDYALVDRSRSPKQSTRLRFVGRESSRTRLPGKKATVGE